MRGLLLTAGLLSLAVAAGLIISQRDLKRMLAYSSIEHMGLLALAAAIGGTLAIAAGLLHALGHGLAKSSLFVVSGRILAVEGTTQIAGIRGLLTRRPAVAVPYLVGMAALLGLPPFSLFFSEVAIVVAGFQGGLGWAMAVTVGLLLVLFAGLARHSASMTLGPGSPAASRPRPTCATRSAASAAPRPRSHRGHRRHHWPPVHPADPSGLAAGGCAMTERPRTRVVDVDRHDVAATLERHLVDGCRVAMVVGAEDDDCLRVVYVLVRPADDQRVELVLKVPKEQPSIPSLAAISYPVGRFEREIRDLYGITPEGHPLPYRLIRHGHWPQGWYAMRRDADPDPRFDADVGSFPFLEVEGEGVYEIPVGPVHAGLIEPGHFRFSVVGETILRMKARLWFVHRGVEKIFEGRRPPRPSKSPNGSAATPPSGTRSPSPWPWRTPPGSR